MTDVNEHLSTSFSSETENVKDACGDGVSQEKRVESETELNCSIETCEGDESITEDEEETKRDDATEGGNSEIEEENEILDIDKEDHSKKVGTESSRPEETLLNVVAKVEENASNTEDLGFKTERTEEGTSSNSPEQRSKAVEHNSKVGEYEKESSNEDKESSKADEECLKANEACSKADEECSKADEEFPKAEECLKVDVECSKADEEFPKAEECLKVDEDCSEANEAFPKADEEYSKADEECSKADKEFPKAEECLKVDEECSKADEEFPKADEEYSKADVECSKAGKEFHKAEECLKVDEECSKADEEFPKADEEYSKADEECLKVNEVCSKVDEEFSKADECLKADEITLKADKETFMADKESLKADEKCLKADEECLNADEETLKADEECLKADEELSKTDEECSKAEEEHSKANEERSVEVEEYLEADEEFSEADEEFSEVENTEIKEKIKAPSSKVEVESSHDVEIISEVEEIIEDAEKHSSVMEGKSSNAEENAKEEISKERNIEMEKQSILEQRKSGTEVWEETSEGEDKEEEVEEEGDTEQEDGSSVTTGTEQEDSEDEGGSNEEEDGSDKDADSVSGWNEKRDVGDGEEETAVKVEKKLDDDEDKANPAYIPRKGTFYEHDLRLEDVDDEDNKDEKQKMSGKRLWVDEHKWEHDRFDARQQSPKSTQELIAVYGFDIRRGKESDIPVRDSMPRTRRPGDKNRFGDFIHRQAYEEHSGDDEGNRDSNRTASNRNRNRMNNENRQYQGRRENVRNNDVSVGFANSDFPALKQNVDIVVKPNAAVAQPVQDKSKEERNGANFRRKPDRRGSRDEEMEEDMDTQERNRSDRRGGAVERNDTDFRRRQDRSGFADEENEEEFDNRRRPQYERRGRAAESRGAPRFNRGRGRGRGGRWQRERYEPDGRNLNWQERETLNEERRDHWNDNQYKDRNARNFESHLVEEVPRRTVGNRESRQRTDSEASHSVDLESRHSRQKDFGNELSDYSPRDGRNVRGNGREARGGDQAWSYDRSRGRGRGKNNRHEVTYDSQEQRPRGGQEHSYRGQRPRQERDHRFRDKDHQESFPTRTIQNSNIPSSGRPFSDAKSREEEKQELLSAVSAEIKKMNLNERELAAKQQAGHSSSVNEKIGDENYPGSYWQGRRFEQRGVDGDTRTTIVNEKPHFHKDLSSAKTARDDSNVDVRRKSAVIIQTTDAPEMLPPVTSIQTFSKPAERTASEPRPSDRPQNKGWAGGEFTPAWRLQSAPANKAETTHPAPSGKPKRYSTLRQKATGAEVAYTEPVNTDYQAATGPALQPLTTALPSRPLPASTYYDSSSSYAASPSFPDAASFPAAPSFHPASGLALGMQQMAAFQMQANAQHGLYNNQPYMNNPQAPKPGTPIHNMYIPHSGSMLPGPYMSMMNYPAHFPMAPVQLPPGAQPTHLHHGSMQDPESVEMHRMMYYNQQGIPMSVMQQYVDQTAYLNEQSQVNHNVGSEGYVGTGELTSPNQGVHEY